MGRLSADAMSEMGEEMGIDIRQQLVWHLTGNHFPPAPEYMAEPCMAAIDAANEDDWDRLIDLPNGATWRGNTQAPASALVSGFHLDSWLSDEGCE
jgi:hypothetical protein